MGAINPRFASGCATTGTPRGHNLLKRRGHPHRLLDLMIVARRGVPPRDPDVPALHGPAPDGGAVKVDEAPCSTHRMREGGKRPTDRAIRYV